MTTEVLLRRLTDLVAFQCVLVALRGVGSEASEEMIWQTFLAALVDQYGFRRAWYGRSAGGAIRPLVMFPLRAPGLEDVPMEIPESSSIVQAAELAIPVSLEGAVEGILVANADSRTVQEREEQIRILTTEVATMVAERRSRRRYEEALKQAKLQAESADRAKSLLLANMSHEIRTPMTGVLGFADLLASTPLTEEQRDYVDTIRSSGEALLSLINDILDFSKIESGRLQLECAPVDLRGVVEKIVGLLAVQAAEKGLRLSFDIHPSAPRAFLGDAMRLRQVLANLLGNAIKFTASGQVSLTVSGVPTEDGHRRIAFLVRDTGPGIPIEHQRRIFDSFSQVDASISRRYGGTGLGLAISKSLAEQMGGGISVESQPGRGAAFCFTIQAQALVDEPQNTQKPAAGDFQVTGLPPLRIVVAEDNPVSRALMLKFLERLGYRPDFAANGVELLNMLEQSTYDVVFMDVQMPEVDGMEATRRIRRDWPPARQPRIVAMTAAAFPEDRARCLEAGMDDYVSKPLVIAELVEALRRAPNSEPRP